MAATTTVTAYYALNLLSGCVGVLGGYNEIQKEKKRKEKRKMTKMKGKWINDDNEMVNCM